MNPLRNCAFVAILTALLAPGARAQDPQPAPAMLEKRGLTSHTEKATCKKPDYPTEARRKGQEGNATIEFLLSTEGFITEARVLRSSGFPLLDQAALIAVVSCRGVPGVTELRSKVAYRWALSE